jgi:TolA-binding protein
VQPAAPDTIDDVPPLSTNLHNDDDADSPVSTMFEEHRDLLRKHEELNQKYMELVKQNDSNRLATDQEVAHPSSWQSKRQPPTAGTYQENASLKDKVKVKMSHNVRIDRDVARNPIKENTRLSKQVRELEGEVDHLKKLTPHNIELRDPEGTELRNQEMKMHRT